MNAIDLSVTGAQNSLPTILQSLTRVAYSFNWSGTSPVGTVNFQFSNDYALNANGTVQNAGTWTTGPGTFALTGNAGNGFIDIVTGAYAIRCVYTKTSGTGNLTSYVNAKVS